jgi:hypothetical protein
VLNKIKFSKLFNDFLKKKNLNRIRFDNLINIFALLSLSDKSLAENHATKYYSIDLKGLISEAGLNIENQDNFSVEISESSTVRLSSVINGKFFLGIDGIQEGFSFLIHNLESGEISQLKISIGVLKDSVFSKALIDSKDILEATTSFFEEVVNGDKYGSNTVSNETLVDESDNILFRTATDNLNTIINKYKEQETQDLNDIYIDDKSDSMSLSEAVSRFYNKVTGKLAEKQETKQTEKQETKQTEKQETKQTEKQETKQTEKQETKQTEKQDTKQT